MPGWAVFSISKKPTLRVSLRYQGEMKCLTSYQEKLPKNMPVGAGLERAQRSSSAMCCTYVEKRPFVTLGLSLKIAMSLLLVFVPTMYMYMYLHTALAAYEVLARNYNIQTAFCELYVLIPKRKKVLISVLIKKKKIVMPVR